MKANVSGLAGVCPQVELRQDGVLTVAVSGLLTPRALLQLRQEVDRNFAGRGISAIVADFTRAAVLVTGPDLDAVAADDEHDSLLGAPAAIVVNPACVDLFRAAALRLASRGLTRRVFVDAAPALAWALQMAARQHR